MNALALTYFRAFAAKDLAQLRELLHADVTLRDWVVEVQGRDEVLAEMSRGFESFASIRVTPVHVFCDQSTVIGELDIALDSEHIKVIDVLEYSSDRKIRAIRAFKG